MASSPPPSWDETAGGDGSTVVRRAPFADSPFVGERGQRARERIVEGALQVFGEVGYHECGIQRITEVSGCSRASFYQYFSDKEDLFRQISGRVARLLADLNANIDPVTPDAAGRAALRAWLDGYAELYQAFAPVFVAFQTAAASDGAVASGGARVAVRTLATLRSKVSGSPLAPRQVDGVVRALPGVAVRTNRMVALLGSLGVTDGVADATRMNDAIADTFHRALFAPDRAVNVHDAPPGSGRPSLPAHTADPLAELAEPAGLGGDPALRPRPLRTRARLVESGHRVFAELGDHATRVEDVIADAGVSRGVFYRYFENKTHLFRVVAEQASARLYEAFAAIPALVGPGAVDDVGGALRSWLTAYAATAADEATIAALWIEAMARDPQLSSVSAAFTELQRARYADLLAQRGFGDSDAEALLLLMLLDDMGFQRATPGRIETTAQIIERAFLTPPPEPG
jgi:AcrR family transcriptional regulator